MEALARIHLFNLDDPAFAPAHRIDGMHAKPAIGNEPRHHDLSLGSPPRKERLSKPFVVVMLRLSSDRTSQSWAGTCLQLSPHAARRADPAGRDHWDAKQVSRLLAAKSVRLPVHRHCIRR
jgi:hypothetical protein